MINECFFDDHNALMNAMTQACEVQLLNALNHSNQASLLVSGGRTPIPLYQRLSKLKLSWSAVNIMLVDERWVADDDPGSNAHVIAQHLMQHNAHQAQLTGMKNDAETPQQGWPVCENNYRHMPRPFDLCILGMGDDGHTASLFPHADGLDAALHDLCLCAPIAAKPSAVSGKYLQRMSLTLHALMQCRNIFLFITGDKKRQVYELAKNAQTIESMPISAILQQAQVPVSVYWTPEHGGDV